MAIKIINNSALFNRAATEYLSRTTSASPTSATTWTLSVWFKRGRDVELAQDNTIFSAGTGNGNSTAVRINGANKLVYQHDSGFSVIDEVISTATFRDPTAWYHLVVRYDSTEVVDSDRVRMWVDGVLLTDFDTANWPSASGTSFINAVTQVHEIGREAGPNDGRFDGYLSEMYFCDGQALSPTNFAEQDAGGSWQPITATPTFGDDGFFLNFSDDLELGDDTSGNVNDWTETGLTAANQREDTPTANHLTWNPSSAGVGVGSSDFERGLLEYNGTSAYTTTHATGLLPKTGKYYWEVDGLVAAAVDRMVVGVTDQLADLEDKIGNDNHGWGLYNPGTTVLAMRHNSADVNFTDTGTLQTGNYAMVAYDTATGQLWFGIDGTWLDSGDPAAGTGEKVIISDALNNDLIPAGSSVSSTIAFRAGSEDFEGTIPAGFSTLDVSTWPAPAVSDPREFFQVVDYAGDGVSPRLISGAAFQPDLVWLKSIDAATSHLITDTVKGGGVVHLNDASAADDSVNPGGDISGFTSGGFNVRAQSGNDDDVNNVGNEYMGFMWKAGAAAGLDIVGYTGTAAAQAINHTLSGIPELMYVRNRDTAGSNDLYYQNLLLAGEPRVDPETDYIVFDQGLAPADDVTRWNDVAPTSTQFTVGTSPETNNLSDNHAAYLWRGIEGLSKFTAYIGTATDTEDAPFIYTGFRPALVVIKYLNANGPGWRMLVRNNALTPGAIGGTDATEYWDPAQATAMTTPTGNSADICASGIKIRQTSIESNFNGSNYIVWAFADIPFSLKSALLTAPQPGDGAVDMEIELAGQASVGHQHGDGAIEVNFILTGNGTGGLPKADAAPFLNIVIDATGDAPSNQLGAGTPAIDIVIDGTARSIHVRGAAAVDMAIAIDATGFNTAIRGSPTLPQLSTVPSAIEQSTDLIGQDTPLPLLQMGAVTILNANPIFGDLRLPVLATNGDINPDFTVDLPALQASGTAISGAVLRAPLVVLPVLAPAGTALNPGVTSGGGILPRLQAVGTLTNSGVVSIPSGSLPIFAQSTMPALQANGFLLVPQELAGSVTLPALDVSPDTILAPGAIVTGSVTLPILRTTTSILVNGVSLTATIWSMNTETLESTNYLNFAFDSLVTFNDQPYGVTSAGIFLLEGDDDAGTNIDARILTGISDRGIESLKEVAQMYMQYDGGAMMFQLFPDGQQSLREYRFDRRSNSSGVIHARAKGSRGLRSRSFQMGLRNLSGQDFTLDKLGLLERILTRKTGKN